MNEQKFDFQVGDEAVVISLGKWMKFVGIFTAIVAGLGLVGAMLMSLAACTSGASSGAVAAVMIGLIGALLALPFIWQGVATSTAGEVFASAAMEPDPQMIAVGMKKLRTAQLIQVIALGLAIFLTVVGAVLFLVGALAFG